MKEYSKKSEQRYSRELIIGLGESSFRKNYYPELQQKIFEMERTNARTKALIEAVPDILLVSDVNNELKIMNVSACYQDELVAFLLGDPEIKSFIERAAKNAKANKEIIEVSYDLLFKGQKHYFEMRCQQTEMNEALIIIRDITQRVVLENRLRDAAEKDSLTGLFNRRSFETKIAQLIHKKAGSLALILVDIDGLKLINDTIGHVAGDKLIAMAAEIISKVFSDFGFIARVGGDEFAILIDDTDDGTVEDLLSQFKQKIREYNQNISRYDISLSFGYFVGRKEEVSAEMLFQQADNNMYQNKLLNSASAKNNIVRSLMKALEARDYITEGHVERLDKYAYMIGKAIRLSSVQLDRIELLAKFHDIGKVGIPDAILNKPSFLNDTELKIMQTHTQIGERIARESGELGGISDLILKHHERWDGRGYPIGLAGKDIPVECRIIAIVDAFDAMTNDRPYRKAVSQKEAIEEIKRCSGTQFDPELTSVFLQTFDESN
jgi:diguanylate cyclase (GGDEF)-like protein